MTRARYPVFGGALLCWECALGMVLWWSNDHLGKVYIPSWLTGKLSDVACLCVFPLLLWSLLELIPVALQGSRWSQQERLRKRLLWFAIVGIGAWFSGINLFLMWAEIHRSVWTEVNAVCWTLFRLAGPSPRAQHTLDPTDCLTLPALAVAFRIGIRHIRAEASPVELESSGYTQTRQ